MAVKQVNQNFRDKLTKALEELRSGVNIQENCTFILAYVQNSVNGKQLDGMFEKIGESTNSKTTFLSSLGMDFSNLDIKYNQSKDGKRGQVIKTVDDLVRAIDIARGSASLSGTLHEIYDAMSIKVNQFLLSQIPEEAMATDNPDGRKNKFIADITEALATNVSEEKLNEIVAEAEKDGVDCDTIISEMDSGMTELLAKREMEDYENSIMKPILKAKEPEAVVAPAKGPNFFQRHVQHVKRLYGKGRDLVAGKIDKVKANKLHKEFEEAIYDYAAAKLFAKDLQVEIRDLPEDDAQIDLYKSAFDNITLSGDSLKDSIVDFQNLTEVDEQLRADVLAMDKPTRTELSQEYGKVMDRARIEALVDKLSQKFSKSLNKKDPISIKEEINKFKAERESAKIKKAFEKAIYAYAGTKVFVKGLEAQRDSLEADSPELESLSAAISKYSGNIPTLAEIVTGMTELSADDETLRTNVMDSNDTLGKEALKQAYLDANMDQVKLDNVISKLEAEMAKDNKGPGKFKQGIDKFKADREADKKHKAFEDAVYNFAGTNVFVKDLETQLAGLELDSPEATALTEAINKYKGNASTLSATLSGMTELSADDEALRTNVMDSKFDALDPNKLEAIVAKLNAELEKSKPKEKTPRESKLKNKYSQMMEDRKNKRILDALYKYAGAVAFVQGLPEDERGNYTSKIDSARTKLENMSIEGENLELKDKVLAVEYEDQTRGQVLSDFEASELDKDRINAVISKLEAERAKDKGKDSKEPKEPSKLAKILEEKRTKRFMDALHRYAATVIVSKGLEGDEADSYKANIDSSEAAVSKLKLDEEKKTLRENVLNIDYANAGDDLIDKFVAVGLDRDIITSMVQELETDRTKAQEKAEKKKGKLGKKHKEKTKKERTTDFDMQTYLDAIKNYEKLFQEDSQAKADLQGLIPQSYRDYLGSLDTATLSDKKYNNLKSALINLNSVVNALVGVVKENNTLDAPNGPANTLISCIRLEIDSIRTKEVHQNMTDSAPENRPVEVRFPEVLESITNAKGTNNKALVSICYEGLDMAQDKTELNAELISRLGIKEKDTDIEIAQKIERYIEKNLPSKDPRAGDIEALKKSVIGYTADNTGEFLTEEQFIHSYAQLAVQSLMIGNIEDAIDLADVNSIQELSKKIYRSIKVDNRKLLRKIPENITNLEDSLRRDNATIYAQMKDVSKVTGEHGDIILSAIDKDTGDVDFSKLGPVQDAVLEKIKEYAKEYATMMGLDLDELTPESFDEMMRVGAEEPILDGDDKKKKKDKEKGTDDPENEDDPDGDDDEDIDEIDADNMWDGFDRFVAEEKSRQDILLDFTAYNYLPSNEMLEALLESNDSLRLSIEAGATVESLAAQMAHVIPEKDPDGNVYTDEMIKSMAQHLIDLVATKKAMRGLVDEYNATIDNEEARVQDADQFMDRITIAYNIEAGTQEYSTSAPKSPESEHAKKRVLESYKKLLDYAKAGVEFSPKERKAISDIQSSPLKDEIMALFAKDPQALQIIQNITRDMDEESKKALDEARALGDDERALLDKCKEALKDPKKTANADFIEQYFNHMVTMIHDGQRLPFESEQLPIMNNKMDLLLKFAGKVNDSVVQKFAENVIGMGYKTLDTPNPDNEEEIVKGTGPLERLSIRKNTPNGIPVYDVFVDGKKSYKEVFPSTDINSVISKKIKDLKDAYVYLKPGIKMCEKLIDYIKGLEFTVTTNVSGRPLEVPTPPKKDDDKKEKDHDPTKEGEGEKDKDAEILKILKEIAEKINELSEAIKNINLNPTQGNTFIQNIGPVCSNIWSMFDQAYKMISSYKDGSNYMNDYNNLMAQFMGLNKSLTGPINYNLQSIGNNGFVIDMNSFAAIATFSNTLMPTFMKMMGMNNNMMTDRVSFIVGDQIRKPTVDGKVFDIKLVITKPMYISITEVQSVINSVVIKYIETTNNMDPSAIKAYVNNFFAENTATFGGFYCEAPEIMAESVIGKEPMKTAGQDTPNASDDTKGTTEKTTADPVVEVTRFKVDLQLDKNQVLIHDNDGVFNDQVVSGRVSDEALNKLKADLEKVKSQKDLEKVVHDFEQSMVATMGND